MTCYEGPSICPSCGEVPHSGVHIFVSNDESRTRLKCPWHKRLCYATRRNYYDTVHFFFDCGTFWDAGYGSWRKPKGVKKPGPVRRGSTYRKPVAA